MTFWIRTGLPTPLSSPRPPRQRPGPQAPCSSLRHGGLTGLTGSPETAAAMLACPHAVQYRRHYHRSCRGEAGPVKPDRQPSSFRSAPRNDGRAASQTGWMMFDQADAIRTKPTRGRIRYRLGCAGAVLASACSRSSLRSLPLY